MGVDVRTDNLASGPEVDGRARCSARCREIDEVLETRIVPQGVQV